MSAGRLPTEWRAATDHPHIQQTWIASGFFRCYIRISTYPIGSIEQSLCRPGRTIGLLETVPGRTGRVVGLIALNGEGLRWLLYHVLPAITQC